MLVSTRFKIHTSLRTMPAMVAGVTSRLCDVADLVALLVESESDKSRVAATESPQTPATQMPKGH
jgi:hypothetical protein